jgi:hypothetical protein
MSNRGFPSTARSMLLVSMGAVFGFMAVSSSPAFAATPWVTFTVDRGPGPQLVPIQATVVPADATGTLTFRLDQAVVGGPVAIVAGAAQSAPVDIPDQQSMMISVEYSGDANYEPVTAVTNYDFAPEEPAPAAQARPARDEIVRTGPESFPLSLLAAALIGVGFVLLRRGKVADRP